MCKLFKLLFKEPFETMTHLVADDLAIIHATGFADVIINVNMNSNGTAQRKKIKRHGECVCVCVSLRVCARALFFRVSHHPVTLPYALLYQL